MGALGTFAALTASVLVCAFAATSRGLRTVTLF
jgi:hypothetical protein